MNSRCHSYLHTSSQYLNLWVFHHGAARSVAWTHHWLCWPLLATCRQNNEYILIYKATFPLLPSYLCDFIYLKNVGGSSFCSITQSQLLLSLSALKMQLEIGEGSFSYAALAVGYRSICDLGMLFSLNLFRSRLKEASEEDALDCRCDDFLLCDFLW